MKRILLGGSPCTFWSIAQTKHREREASGMGWELFLNYVIAKEKFHPDIFLYENNVSASRDVKDAIRSALNVWEGAIIGGEDTGVRYIEIDSALVSAQMHKRFYVHNCGDIGQPEPVSLSFVRVSKEGVVSRSDGTAEQYARCSPASMRCELGLDGFDYVDAAAFGHFKGIE